MPDYYEEFTEEALRAQDGKKVPLKFGNDGPVIGEAIFHYDESTNELKFDTTFHKDLQVPFGPWLTGMPKEGE